MTDTDGAAQPRDVAGLRIEVRLVRLLTLVALALVAGHVLYLVARLVVGWDASCSGAIDICSLQNVADLNSEATIGTWFASLLLLTCSLLAAAMGTVAEGSDRWGWLVLASSLGFLSIDEVAELHEKLSGHIQAVLDLDGVLLYPWVVPAAIAAGLVGVALRPFLSGLPAATRSRFTLAAAVYFGGAVGLEVVGAWFSSGHGVENATYVWMTGIEESMELAGALLALRALLLETGGVVVAPQAVRRP